MRKLFIAIAFLILITGCRVPIDISDNIPEQVISGYTSNPTIGCNELEGTGVLSTPILDNVGIPINLSNHVEPQDIPAIKEITLKKLNLTITDTKIYDINDEDTFGFLNSLIIYADSNSYPEVKIAEKLQIDGTATSIDFDEDQSVDILPYIKEGLVLNSNANGNLPCDDVSFQGSLVLYVKF